MRTIRVSCYGLAAGLLLSTGISALPPTPADPAARDRALAAYRRLPLAFEANRGQAEPRVRFRARGDGYGLSLGPGAAVMTFGSAGSPPLRLELAGGDPAAMLRGEAELAGRANYLRGNAPAAWRTGVPLFERVRYAGLYPGIDLVFYGRERRIEHDFVVAPGADLRRIRLRLSGADRPRIDVQGDLVLREGLGGIRLSRPVAYQEAGGARRAVAARYRLLPRPGAAPDVGFALGTYDRALPLVVDPVLVYSASLPLLGLSSVALDGAGNAYLTGETDSSDVPGALQLNHGRYPADAFVAKLDPRGALVYVTVFGGSFFDAGYSVAVDRQGSAYVAGQTYSYDLPYGPSGPPEPPEGGSSPDFILYGAGFLLKLDPSGSSVVYTRLVGGGNQLAGSFATDVAVDSHGVAYLLGNEEQHPYLLAFGPQGLAAGSSGYPDECAADPGRSYYTALAVDARDELVVTGLTNDFHVFVGKVDSSGQTVYSVCLQGSASEVPAAVATGPAGDAYVTGWTDSDDFPVVSPLQPATKGGRDVFVTRLDPAGRIVYSTYLGGAGREESDGIGVDALGRAYVTGATTSPDFPLVRPMAYVCRPGPGAACPFLVALDARGQALQYSTFLGGSGPPPFGPPEYGLGEPIAVDARGVVTLLGRAIADNPPPLCAAAHALPATLAPPDGRAVPISIAGVTDPEGEPVAISILSIRQDEPTGGSPDASGIGTATAQVRAERAGGGDGRVYHLAFTATDAQGATCGGTVAVCVPHDQGHGRTCGDGGALYGSTAGGR